MSQLPPPYGPHPTGPGPARPPKPRPSAGWFAVGIVLIVGAVGAGVGLFVWTLSGFSDTDVTVARDGRAHAVALTADHEQMLWSYDFDRQPDCRVVDRSTDEEVPLRRPGGDFRRNAGSAGDWVGTWRFDSGSGDLEITCSRSGSTPLSTVEIGPAPRIGSFVVGILATILVPLALGLAGVIVLLVTGILWSLRPAQPR
ncbi:hypothetical protein [Nocardioides sp.]|uniref:hypothetical protein n=1 Tax=Nocardioides sp. TaxID=35761 RepID=UPI0025FF321D|nr:hypothetical protein [Nocardioides sp.]